jgi:pilus assembly protein CpaB
MIKNRRALLALATAIVLGFAAVALASRWMLRQGGSSANRIVVAAADVNLGQRLTPEMLRLADWPADSMPTGAVTDPAKLAGRVVRTTVLRGEPVSEPKLAPSGTIGGLSALISEGKRAMTVRVNDVVGVAGFALPGNYVDILVHTEQEDTEVRKDRHISKLVLERVLVLAVAQEVGRDETKPRVVNAVTLEVTPAEAEEVDLARSVGTLSLVLRNQVDPHSATTAGATKRSVLQLAEAAPPAKPPSARPRPAVLPVAPKNCVGVISGAHTTRECF